MLFQDGRKVRFGNVIREGAVTEDHGAVAGGLDLGMLLGNAKGQRLHFLSGDLFVEAGEQRASADGVDGLARDVPGVDGHAEIEAELEQQFTENVLLTSVSLDVIDAVEQRLVQIFAVRLPGADVGRISLKTRKPTDGCVPGLSWWI